VLTSHNPAAIAAMTNIEITVAVNPYFLKLDRLCLAVDGVPDNFSTSARVST